MPQSSSAVLRFPKVHGDLFSQLQAFSISRKITISPQASIQLSTAICHSLKGSSHSSSQPSPTLQAMFLLCTVRVTSCSHYMHMWTTSLVSLAPTCRTFHMNAFLQKAFKNIERKLFRFSSASITMWYPIGKKPNNSCTVILFYFIFFIMLAIKSLGIYSKHGCMKSTDKCTSQKTHKNMLY